MIIRILIEQANATKENVICKVRFTAIGGPHDGQFLVRQFTYVHPTSEAEIVAELTTYANALKISFVAPGVLNGMTWEV